MIMSERLIKINLLDQCPDNCGAMEITADKIYACDELFCIKHYCKHVDVCARVFESMEDGDNK